jgi:hypothetical protein
MTYGSLLFHYPVAPHAFTGVQGPSSSSDPARLDTRANAKSSQILAGVTEDASNTAKALLA